MYRVTEWLVCFVTRLAFAIRQTAEIYRMLEVDRSGHGSGSRRIRQHTVTDIAVVANHFPGVADMLAVMTAKTS